MEWERQDKGWFIVSWKGNAVGSVHRVRDGWWGSLVGAALLRPWWPTQSEAMVAVEDAFTDIVWSVNS